MTLDPDVETKLRGIATDRKIPFKQAINDVLRRGLEVTPPAAAPYRLPARYMGLRPGIDLSQAIHQLDEIEDARLVEKMHGPR